MSEQTELTLVDYLAQVPDFRRAEGRRYPLPTLLVMITMAILSGRYGYREIARFLKTNQAEGEVHSPLVAQLGISRKQMPLGDVPSPYVTLRTVLMRLDFDSLNHAFRDWAQSRLSLEAGDWISLDAKAIRSTFSGYNTAYQDFACLVSAFAQKQGLVLATERYHNKDTSEIIVTRDLIKVLVETLGLEGVVFTMDALHCKKNGAPHC